MPKVVVSSYKVEMSGQSGGQHQIDFALLNSKKNDFNDIRATATHHFL